jgi:chromosome segregation ATPase
MINERTERHITKLSKLQKIILNLEEIQESNAVKINCLNNELNHYTAQLEEQNTAHELAMETIEGIHASTIEDMEQELASEQSTIYDLEEHLNASSERIEELEQELEDARTTLNQEVDEATERTEELEREVEEATERTEELEQEVEESTERKEELEQELEESTEIIEELERSNWEGEQIIISKSNCIKDLKEEIEGLKAENQQKEKMFLDINSSHNDLNKALEDAKEEIKVEKICSKEAWRQADKIKAEKEDMRLSLIDHGDRMVDAKALCWTLYDSLHAEDQVKQDMIMDLRNIIELLHD